MQLLCCVFLVTSPCKVFAETSRVYVTSVGVDQTVNKTMCKCLFLFTYTLIGGHNLKLGTYFAATAAWKVVNATLERCLGQPYYINMLFCTNLSA